MVYFDLGVADNAGGFFRCSGVPKSISDYENEREASFSGVWSRPGHGGPFHLLSVDWPEGGCRSPFELSGAGLSCHFSYAVLPFSAKSPVRHLSERLRLVTRTLLGWTGSFEDTPAAFSLVIPSTYTRLLL